MNDRILIEQPSLSQVNRIFIPGETHTIGNPLCIAMNKNVDGCELATYVYNKHNKGIKFSIRTKPGQSAVSLFREELEKLILQTEEVILKYKSAYGLACNNGIVRDPSKLLQEFDEL